MSGVNRVTILGRLGQDPDTRYTQAGEAVVRLSLATSSRYKDKTTGEPREDTEWHRCVCFGRTAEIASQYLAKGRETYVEGRLRTRKWRDEKTGADRYATEIVVDQLTLIGGRPTDAPAGASQPPAAAPSPAPAATRTPPQRPPAGPEPEPWDMDIPF